MTSHRILTTLRVSVHVLVALLLAIGLAGVVAQRDWLAVALAGVFAGAYLFGTLRHHRGLVHSPRVSAGWLAVIIALWVALSALSASFVWLEFPLVILACFLLPTWSGLMVTAGLLAYTLSVTVPDSGIGGLIGPVIGTVLAIGIVHAYQALRGEAEHYRQVAADLEAAQLELAAVEHAAGRAEERERLSREVHDTMAQGLSSIVLLSRALDKELDKELESPRAREILTTIAQTASDNLAEARRFVAAGVSKEPLTARIDRLARAAQSRQKALGVGLEVRVNAVDLQEPAASVAERVVREGLSNVVRHAGATLAVVTVDKLELEATVDVYDNGRGISGPEGYGLKGLRARVEEIGGELTVEGNVLAASLPLVVPKEEH
ncbi:sensor histidine kinase [Corynebacterium aquatimens]|uniref:histidine kinase n=1 Tax=Corynebacterium aquatimens TaxID=1190508 RepID=A0A931E2M2_9CORY|nr:histidine kinase [Corynebacterium aquatimens]MBG6123113.1 signal transduction histidine kinase [Corynebacterium aquatimens]WJY66555.1 Sensor histidine kinase DesK [Corynebacterium aquatimens]